VRALLSAGGLALLLTGCAASTPRWYSVPQPIAKESLPVASRWAGVAVAVTDERLDPGPGVIRGEGAGLTWQTYSSELCQQTRAALLAGLGPTRAGTPLEIRVTITEQIAKFTWPSWRAETRLVARLFGNDQQTGQRWLATGQDWRVNWRGLETAQEASQASYEAAIRDLLRQIALTRPPA